MEGSRDCSAFTQEFSVFFGFHAFSSVNVRVFSSQLDHYANGVVRYMKSDIPVHVQYENLLQRNFSGPSEPDPFSEPSQICQVAFSRSVLSFKTISRFLQWKFLELGPELEIAKC